MKDYLSLFPMPLDDEKIVDKLAVTIRNRRITHIRDAMEEPGISAMERRLDV